MCYRVTSFFQCSEWHAWVRDGNLLRPMGIDRCTTATARGGELCPKDTWSVREIIENTSEHTQIYEENRMSPCQVCINWALGNMPETCLREKLRNTRDRRENGLREAWAGWPAMYERLLTKERNQGEFQRQN